MFIIACGQVFISDMSELKKLMIESIWTKYSNHKEKNNITEYFNWASYTSNFFFPSRSDSLHLTKMAKKLQRKFFKFKNTLPVLLMHECTPQIMLKCTWIFTYVTWILYFFKFILKNVKDYMLSTVLAGITALQPHSGNYEFNIEINQTIVS